MQQSRIKLTMPFDVPEAEAEAMIKPDGIGNDLRRKAVATIWGRLCAHRDRVCRISRQLDSASQMHVPTDIRIELFTGRQLWLFLARRFY